MSDEKPLDRKALEEVERNIRYHFKEIMKQVRALAGALDEQEAERSPERDADIKEVFEYWRDRRESVMGYSSGPRMNLSSTRRARINARLDEGYSVADCEKAVDGMLGSDFNIENDHTDCELCFRSQKHIERYMAKADERNKKSAPYKEYTG